jgi:hypothetical protein
LMVNNPQFEWLALSLKGEVAGWMRNEEVTTLPRPQPPRPSAQTFRLMK